MPPKETKNENDDDLMDDSEIDALLAEDDELEKADEIEKTSIIKTKSTQTTAKRKIIKLNSSGSNEIKKESTSNIPTKAKKFSMDSFAGFLEKSDSTTTATTTTATPIRKKLKLNNDKPLKKATPLVTEPVVDNDDDTVLLPATQRADGTWRKPKRVKQAFVKQASTASTLLTPASATSSLATNSDDVAVQPRKIISLLGIKRTNVAAATPKPTNQQVKSGVVSTGPKKISLAGIRTSSVSGVALSELASASSTPSIKSRFATPATPMGRTTTPDAQSFGRIMNFTRRSNARVESDNMEFEALGVDEALNRLMRLTRHDCIQSIAKLRRQQGTLLLNNIAKQFGLRVEVFDDDEQDLNEFGAVFKSRNSKSKSKANNNDDDNDNDNDDNDDNDNDNNNNNDNNNDDDDQSNVNEELSETDETQADNEQTNDTSQTTTQTEFKKPAKIIKKRGRGVSKFGSDAPLLSNVLDI